jgi:hypothetical protein
MHLLPLIVFSIMGCDRRDVGDHGRAVERFLNAGGRGVPLASSAVLAVATSIFAAAAGRGRARALTPGLGPGNSIALGIFAGVLMAGFYPLLRSGAWGEEGLGPNGTEVLFGAGMWLSTFLLNPFFPNFGLKESRRGTRAYFTRRRAGTFPRPFWGNNLDGRRGGSLCLREFALPLGCRLRFELCDCAERHPPLRAPRLKRVAGFGVSSENDAGSNLAMPGAAIAASYEA